MKMNKFEFLNSDDWEMNMEKNTLVVRQLITSGEKFPSPVMTTTVSCGMCFCI